MVWLNIWNVYDKLAYALSKHGFDVIRHNHRGHGINIDESTRALR